MHRRVHRDQRQLQGHQHCGYKGISTAGHCSDSTNSYDGLPISFMAGSVYPNGDLQWSRFTGSVTLSNQVKISNSGIYRAITSATDPNVSMLVCYYGKTTNQHCGTVVTANRCAGAFCRLFEVNTASTDYGDSGGPWFYDQTALGDTVGYIDLQPGHGNDLASRVSNYGSLGLTVKITP